MRFGTIRARADSGGFVDICWDSFVPAKLYTDAFDAKGVGKGMIKDISTVMFNISYFHDILGASMTVKEISCYNTMRDHHPKEMPPFS